MAWRSVVISQPVTLSIRQGQLRLVFQSDDSATVPVEDISAVVLDNPQVKLSGAVLSRLAECEVAVLTVGSSHLPNGIFLPFLSYHRNLRRLRSQLALKRPAIKRWHKEIVTQKIENQAATLVLLGQLGQGGAVAVLHRLARTMRSGDPGNHEAQAARAYFRSLCDTPIVRGEDRFYNAALNYGYAVLRACIARQLAASGLHPSLGLFHDNEQNPFNLADDFIEPYRPLLDYWVCRNFPEEPQRNLTPEDKGAVVRFLHTDIGNNHNDDCGTVLASIEMAVQRFGVACENPANAKLWLPTHPAAPPEK